MTGREANGFTVSQELGMIGIPKIFVEQHQRVLNRVKGGSFPIPKHRHDRNRVLLATHRG